MVDIEDGLSNTFMLVEDADRPTFHPQNLTGYPSAFGQAQWGDPTNAIVIEELCRGTSAINCHNSNEIFSFHPGGANVVFMDGHVQFLRDSTPTTVIRALVSRDGGEVVTLD